MSKRARKAVATPAEGLYKCRWPAWLNVSREMCLDTWSDGGMPWLLTAEGSFPHLGFERAGRTFWREPRSSNDNGVQWGEQKAEGSL